MFADLFQHALTSFEELSKTCLTTSAMNDAPVAPSFTQSSETTVADSYEHNCDGFMFDTSQPIGSGGYGHVYRGKYIRYDAAIKVTDCREMFTRECVALKRAQSHPCVVELFGVQDERMWLAMELAEGDLFTLVCDARLDELAARRFFAQMLSALEHLHTKNIVHRDVKLENWLTFTNERIKLADFGLSYVYADDESNLTLSGFVGSRSYCAPEILLRKSYNGFVLDSWSVTVCLFAMVTGFFPFDEASTNDWRYRRIFSTPNDDIVTAIFGLYNRPCTLSSNLCDFIHRVFSSESLFRPPIRDMQEHPWMHNKIPLLDEVVVDEAVWRSCQILENTSTPRLCRMAADKFNRESG